MTHQADRKTDPAAGYEALRTTAAAHVLPRDVVRVSGPEATSYLQGQCSQDVAGLGPGAAADALLLSPQGKVDAFIRVIRTADDEFVIDADAGFGPVVTARLERFRLRTKVQIEPLAWVCVAVRGPAAAEAIVGKPPLGVPVEWPGLSGFDLLGPAPMASEAPWVGDQTVRCGDEAWEAARIEAGVPVNGREVVEGTIAAEVGLVDRAVSFTKGCFTGQELVARLDARGSKVARRLCGVVLETAGDDGGDQGEGPGSAAPPVGATVFTSDRGHEVGHLTSVAWSPGIGAPVALAVLHRRVSPPADVSVSWGRDGDEGEGRAEARPLPLIG
ncbi:MAG: folate-binding protein YgfZ [Acidimicrobiales bacterium]|nr:folate-binding protein YgfZ [Acidimicrobiales bacterium]